MTQELGQVRYNGRNGQWERYDGRTWVRITTSLAGSDELLVFESSGGAGADEGPDG